MLNDGIFAVILQVGTLAGLYTAFDNFLNSIFLFIPNLIGALIILLVGYLITRAVVKGIGFVMRRTSVDRHVSATDLGRWVSKSGHTFTDVILSVIKWLMYFIVIVYAVSALEVPPLTATMVGILAYIPNLIAVAIIVFVGAIAASIIGRFLENTLPRYGVAAGRIIGLIVQLFIYALVFNAALIQLGFAQGILFVTTTALAWGLAAALAVGLGVPIAYSLKGVLTPMVVGAASISGSLREGQEISVGGVPNLAGDSNGVLTGTVRAVGTISIVVERSDGGAMGGRSTDRKEYVIVPNNLLTDRPVVVRDPEPPRPVDHNLRNRLTDLDRKYGEEGGRRETGTERTMEEESPPPPPR